MSRRVKLLAPIRWNGPPSDRVQGESPSGVYDVVREEPEGGVAIDAWAGVVVSLHPSEFVEHRVSWT